MPQEERRKDMQKNILVIAAICVCIFAFSIVFVMPPVSAAARSSIVITDIMPTELHPGDTRDVILTVKNNGAGDARDVRLNFQVEDKKNVTLVGRTEVQIPALNAWREKKVKIKVHVEEGIPNGVYVIPVKYSWYEYYFDPELGYYITIPNNLFYLPDGGSFWGNPVTSDISFTVKGSAIITIGEVYTEPVHVRQGYKNVKMTVQVWNTGEANAKDVMAKLSCNDKIKPSRSGSDQVYIGKMTPGKGVTALFYVDIAEDVKAGFCSIPLRIQYKDTGNVESELEKSIDVVVEGKPKLEVLSHYTEPTNISAGDYVRLHVKVRNTGSEAAKSVSVRVTEAADAPFNFSKKSDNVGDLKVNKVGNAILEFSVDANATNKVYPQGLEIRCAGDPDAGNYTFDKKIQLEVFSDMPEGSPEEPSSSTPGFEALFSLMTILIISGFLLCMKKRK